MNPMCPECAAGKHPNCTIETINDADEMVPCGCQICHPPREAHNVHVVFDSGETQELFNVTPEQVAQFLELHPDVHIYEGATNVQDQ